MAMKIRFYHAVILPMGRNGMELIRDGELHVNGTRIDYVGKSIPGDGNTAGSQNESISASVRTNFDREIDCQGNLLIPGFKNAHAHGPMTFLRSLADDLPLDKWLNQQVFPAEAMLTVEDTYWLQKLAVLEYLTSGITASFEMYFIDEGIRQVARELGFRTVLCGAACGDDLDWLKRLETDLKCVEKKKRLKTDEGLEKASCMSPGEDDDLITFQLGFHAEYSTERRLLEGIAGLANQYQVPVYTHCQETKKETLECVERYGSTPVQFLADLGMFNYGGGLFHGVYPMEGDIACMKQHDISVITNPGSNAKLASGIAPLTTYAEAGILLGLGTDGPASNNCLDMFWEMHLATALQKVDCLDACALPAEQVFSMATVNNARIMGLVDCDTLETGKRADLVMIDLKQPNMQPENHLVKNLVYSGSKQNVYMTMVSGQILYERGTFSSNIDAEEIYAKAGEIAKKIMLK